MRIQENATVMNVFGNLVDIPITDPQPVRQRKLLDALLILVVMISVVQELVILAILGLNLPIHPPLAQPEIRVRAHMATFAVIALCGLVFVVNRYVSAYVARILFILLLVASVFANTPDDWLLATLTYAISVPIVIISFLMKPFTSFILAVLGSVATSVVGAALGVGIYVTPIFNFLIVSVLAWFTARTLEHALVDLRLLNRELDLRVVERTQELAEALEREQAEASKNKAILEGIADGVIVFDRRGTAMVANPACRTLLGEPVEAIIGRDPSDLMDGHVPPENQETILGSMSSLETFPQGLKIPWDDKTLSVSLAPVEDRAGGTIGIVVAFRDYTREAEIDRMKSAFVSIASHELRTPLNAILGYVDMLQEGVYGPLQGAQKGVVERVVANTRHLFDLADSLLDRAQIEAGRLTLHETFFAPADLVVEVQDVMRVVARGKGLELTRRVASDVPGTLFGDRRRLRQILMNLVANAVKFTELGRVEMSIHKVDQDHWALEVSDTGCGIPEEQQASIFEPFRQADESATRAHGGVGLGLSIVRDLVALMDGEIKLTSEVGKGSTFTIVLPLVTGERESNSAALSSHDVG